MEVEDIIIFNADYKIFICLEHGYALTKPATHLYEEHKSLSKEQRKAIVQRHQHEEAVSWNAVRTPPRHSTPIPGLKAPIVASLCAAEGCGWVSSHPKGIEMHARQTHHWRKTQQQPTFWSQVWAQTWFTAAGKIKYFCVRMPADVRIPDSTSGPSSVRSARQRHSMPSHTANTPQVNPLPSQEAEDEVAELNAKAAAMDAAHELEMEKLEAEMLKQDSTGWWSRTLWQKHFQGRNLKWLSHTSRLPDRDEPLLAEIVEIFNVFFAEAKRGIQTLDQETRRWLRSEKRGEISPRPFMRLQNIESEERYEIYMCRFLCHVMRVWFYSELEARENAQDAQHAATDASFLHVSTDDFHRESNDVSAIINTSVPPSPDNHETFDEDINPETHINCNLDDERDDENDLDYDSDIESDEEQGEGEGEDSTLTNITTPMVSEPYEEVDETRDARELFPWTPAQRQCTAQLYHTIYDQDQSQHVKIEAMRRFFTQFVFHRVGGDKFRSGLIHFTAVLGIDEENRRLKEPVDFSYILAGLTWDMRVLGAELLLPAAKRERQLNEPAWNDRFLEWRREYLCDGGGTPMSELINLLAYGKHLALNSSNAATVTWSRDKNTIFYKGIAIALSSFRQMVQDNIQHAERLLWENLMWVRDESQRFTIDLDLIQDDQTFTLRGYSFLKQSSNGLEGGRQWMFRQMLRQRGKFRLRGLDKTWKLRNVRRYLTKEQDFLELLAFAIHSSYGSVARGTELTAIRHRNGALQDRNHYIIDGASSIIIRYYKSQQLFGTPKIIPRFPPWRVNQMLVIYLAYARQLCEYLLVETQNRKISDHLWYDEKGPRETDWLTRIIKRQTALGLGYRFHTLDFRHLVVSIGREVVSDKFAEGYKEELGEVEEPEQEFEDPLELQSGRGEAFGVSRYGVRADIVKHMTPKLIETFRPISEGWHRFLGLASVASQLLQTPLHLSGTTITATATATATSSVSQGKRSMRESWEIPRHTPRWRALSQANPGLLEPSDNAMVRIYASAAQIEEGLHQLFGAGAVGFRSREQEEGTMAVLYGETPVTIVIPTGGGKTVLAMLPVVLEKEGVSIFIAPFRALVDDVVARFRKAGMHCIEWRVGEINPARIVVVSADIAVKDSFMTYGRTLVKAGLLRRIFIDEGHCTFTDSHWRKNLSRVRRVRSLGCPTYILTATLPPRRVSELEDSLDIRYTRIIRASTIRPRHQYLVQRCRPDELEKEASRICQRQLHHLVQRGERGVVYSLSRDFCMSLAEQLQCHHYHAGVHDRAERLEHWVGEGGLIVATSALGTGVDIPGIVFILHVDIPFSMIDFAQQSGRGGRGGEDVHSLILVPNQKAETRLRQGGLGVEDEVMAQFVATAGCRRRVMGEYLDGPELAQSCGDNPEWLRCDGCGEGAHEASLRTQEEEDTRRRVEEAMTEMKIGCVYCWINGEDRTAPHSTQKCDRAWWCGGEVERFRGGIRYQSDTHSCHRCGISQHLCATGQEGERVCQWPGVMAPVIYCMMQSSVGYRQVQMAGYLGGYQDWESYARWLGKRHFQRVWGENMSNAMAVLIRAIRYCEGESVERDVALEAEEYEQTGPE
jgi:superfamily II DNA helicase RecQ